MAQYCVEAGFTGTGQQFQPEVVSTGWDKGLVTAAKCCAGPHEQDDAAADEAATLAE
ncbi:MAG: hypothetical protein V4577_04325 [Bacteroidota bacterium]